MNKIEIVFALREIANNLNNDNIEEAKKSLCDISREVFMYSEPVVVKKTKEEELFDKIFKRLDDIESNIRSTRSQISEQNMHWDMYTM